MQARAADPRDSARFYAELFGWSTDGGHTWVDSGVQPLSGGVLKWPSDPYLALDEPSEPPLFAERFGGLPRSAEPVARVRVVNIYRFVSAY